MSDKWVSKMQDDRRATEVERLRAEVERLTAERNCPCRDCQMARLGPSVYPTRREMILCPRCGNKRCPHATNHNHACTDSNDPGQEGSEYQFAWSQQAEIDKAVVRTIERCAEVCANIVYPEPIIDMDVDFRIGFDEAVTNCAAAIRALLEEAGE